MKSEIREDAERSLKVGQLVFMSVFCPPWAEYSGLIERDGWKSGIVGPYQIQQRVYRQVKGIPEDVVCYSIKLSCSSTTGGDRATITVPVYRLLLHDLPRNTPLVPRSNPPMKRGRATTIILEKCHKADAMQYLLLKMHDGDLQYVWCNGVDVDRRMLEWWKKMKSNQLV